MQSHAETELRPEQNYKPNTFVFPPIFSGKKISNVSADVFYSPAQQQRESKLCVNINAGFKSLSRIFFFVGSVDVQSDPPYGKLRWAGAEREPLGDEDEERMQMSKC